METLDDDERDTCFICKGALLRVRFMRYEQGFPALDFLRQFPADLMRFKQRAEEMAEFGKIELEKKGHPLKGKYRELHQFNMELTRSWGFRTGTVYVVVYAAKKRTTGQEPDYEKALALREDYLNRVSDDQHTKPPRADYQ